MSFWSVATFVQTNSSMIWLFVGQILHLLSMVLLDVTDFPWQTLWFSFCTLEIKTGILATSWRIFNSSQRVISVTPFRKEGDGKSLMPASNPLNDKDGLPVFNWYHLHVCWKSMYLVPHTNLWSVRYWTKNTKSASRGIQGLQRADGYTFWNLKYHSKMDENRSGCSDLILCGHCNPLILSRSADHRVCLKLFLCDGPQAILLFGCVCVSLSL